MHQEKCSCARECSLISPSQEFWSSGVFMIISREEDEKGGEVRACSEWKHLTNVVPLIVIGSSPSKCQEEGMFLH